MGIRSQHGFTILEVILFLAISGVLLVALIGGVNVNINQERYKDSVNGFVAALQEQYVLATNITSTRSSEWTCGTALKLDTGADTTRGTTDCAIIGRVVQGKEDGTGITVSNVVAYNINEQGLENATSDIDALQNDMTLEAMSNTESSSENDWKAIDLGWGSQFKVVQDGAETDGAFTVAILRSPLTGGISTYITPEVTNDWKNRIITADNATRGLSVCISPSSFIGIPRFAVAIAQSSVSTAGVSRVSGGEGC